MREAYGSGTDIRTRGEDIVIVEMIIRQMNKKARFEL
jgi:hypothetical protein